ncbi:MAG: discoidin domain-containing protein [Candidatus Symbiothrix sp.]|jgi:alpha-mannosidase|nr:discoidin domain-containing protein [Candidatus Symbiothrix sp.]
MNKYFLVALLGLSVLNLSAQLAPEKPKVYVVSNAHFDSQWNWDVQTSINEYVPKTLEQNLMLLEKYPDYIFNFEGGIKYSWMKEYYPYLYEKMKHYINEGRWHVTGSTWEASDTNIPSPESFTRNILYGQHFYRNEFGVSGTDIFLPDCFGFGWTLPTLAAHSGLIGFSTQKLQWRNRPFYGNSKIPFELGLWQGVDGSRIFLAADGHSYGMRWRDEDLSDSPYLQKLLSNSPLNVLYHYYGTGDTGGAPTIESVRAVEKSVNGNGKLQIISATSDQLYKDYLPFDQHPELPVFDGELLMDVHGTGCYTSQAAMKLFNRRNEQLADAAERSAVVADWLGGLAYPKQNLNEAWKRFLWHQFHDDLTGTSIPRAYEFSWNDELLSLKQFSNVLTSSVGAASRALDTQVKGQPLVIYNPLAYPVSETVELLLNDDKVQVYNEKNEKVPVQTAFDIRGNKRLLIAVSVPACGYVVYDIRSAKPAKDFVSQANKNEIENSVYRVRLNENGDIASIWDKRYNKELVKAGETLRLALFTENPSTRWPAWEIMKTVIDSRPVAVTDDVKIALIEQGALRSTLCVERRYNNSSFKQYIRLNEGEQADRIDIVNEIDWQTTNALLKAEFPLSVSNEKATYDLGVGAVERGNNTPTQYEVYAQNWADLTDANQSYGVSILNDCKYGWDKPNNNTLRLTLLHTPKTAGHYSYQSKQDFGKHVFTYSIVGHAGDYRSAGIVKKAEILNQPVKAFVAEKQKGDLGKSFSFLQIDNENVLLKSLKQAENSDEYIVRFYETSGKSKQSVSISFAGNLVSAKETTGVEDEITGADFTGNRLLFDIPAFGIKTFKIKLAAPAGKLQQPFCQALELPYHSKAASYDAFRKEVNFDGKGNSFAAELLPKTVLFNGIEFQLAGGDEPNIIKCHRDTIHLPQGDFNRLYLLATAAQNDARVDFIIDKQATQALIPYYGGFIGQWGHINHTESFLTTTDVAFVGTHKHNMLYNKNLPYEYTYLYVIALDVPKNARRLILPENQQIAIFAATLSNDANNNIRPVTDLLQVYLPEKEANDGGFFKNNLLLRKSVTEKSGEINEREQANFAIDSELTTKWCDISDVYPKYMTVDLGEEKNIRGWSVFHAGLELTSYITKEYSLQIKSNEGDEWKTVDTVFDNKHLETDRLLQHPETARFVRLNITKPDQDEGTTVRIYDFQVY